MIDKLTKSKSTSISIIPRPDAGRQLYIAYTHVLLAVETAELYYRISKEI